MFETAGPPLRAAAPGSPGARRGGGPPGWPDRVPPPGAAGWEPSAVAWLLDQCPSDYRLYAAWRRHPIALAWLTVRHLEAQLDAMREAYRGVRVDLGEHIGAQGIHDILGALEAEGVRLVAARRSADLVLEALEGHVFVPRL